MTAVLAGVAGLLVGALTVIVLTTLARRADQRAEPDPDEALPAGVREMLEVLSTAVVVLDDTEAVIQASPAARRLGLVRDGWLAVPALARLVSDVRSGTRDDAPAEIEVPGREPPNGQQDPLGQQSRALRVRVVPLTGTRPERSGPLWVVLADDVTESRRTEAIRRDFVANVSHELKTPVGAISLLAETVADAADDPEAVRRFSGRIQREAARLVDLVQEIIDLSRLQSTEATRESGPVDVDTVVAEACDRVRTTAEGRRTRLVVGAPSHARVRGDQDMLVTALRNLVHNAVIYSPEDSRVGIAARVRDGVVELTVTDQGIGIPAGEQDRIFERFYRVDPARSRRTGGSGLGLSIVKHTAVKHGGSVSVWSRPGRGSTFSLRLPALGADDDPAPSSHGGRAGGDAGEAGAERTERRTKETIE